METPLKPETEVSRLNTLTSLAILDTEEEERFNRVIRIAKKTFDVPIAIVSLVDENRQWFKSCLGLDVRETSRAVSFCGHAILDEKIFVVENTLEDKRFFDNPLVLGQPYIRFYAGCPITVLNARIGTLCIIDSKPRIFLEEEKRILRDLAKLVEQELTAVQFATIDQLTGISNRRGLINLVQSGIELCARKKIISTFVFFDLNKFKYINDTFGHGEGDNAIITFAKLMSQASRDSDVTGRLGGDEFVLWLSNCEITAAQNYINRLNKLLKEHNQKSKKGYEIHFSYGMVQVNPSEQNSVESILNKADQLMYGQKKLRNGSKNMVDKEVDSLFQWGI